MAEDERLRGNLTWLPLAHGQRLELQRPLVMAILNATPDSFSDGGRLADDTDGAILAAVRDGADILDIGGESTRPGHTPVTSETEWQRVQPVLAACRRLAPETPISIDTRKAAVAKLALDAGAHFVNDVSGLDDPGMAAVVRQAACSVVLMRHRDLVGDPVRGCKAELAGLVARARAAGIPDAALIVDPGLGFGSPPGGDVAANLALLRGVRDYAQGFPVLIGASRKRFIGALAGQTDARQRLAGSVDAALQAVRAGASLVRVHDVKETVLALRGFTL